MKRGENSLIYQIKVFLKNSKPPIWRRLLVPSTIKLSELHSIIQITMGWTGSHLHQFICGDLYYGVPDPEYGGDVQDESRIKLNKVLQIEKDSILYEYDFGDNWEHQITLEKIIPFKDCIVSEKSTQK